MKILTFSFSLLAVACASFAEPEPLYGRLGGKEGITKVVDQFVTNVLADESIRPFFAITANNPKRAVRFKKMLVDQICEASGGPCKYVGKDMKTAHANMAIRDRHFNALVRALVRALNTYKVSAQEKKELLSVLGPMKGDIVEKKQ